MPDPQRLYWIEQGRRIQYPDSSASSRSLTPFGSSNNSIPNPSALELPPQAEQPFSLQELFTNSTSEVLESAVNRGVEALRELKLLLSRIKIEEASHWLAAIIDTQKKAEQPKTIVGVVGNTGAGKSSVINAVLDEERLVPTNCMRACTAVATEISYNYINDLYRAEIEFITQLDWQRELNILLQDLLDTQGKISHDAANADSEAGVAYAKIKAVYPNYSREQFQKCSVEDLINHRNVLDILGTTKEVTASNSLLFYKQVQSFIDSREKITGERGEDKGTAKKLEYWPLIKVVRLYVKAAPLSTGAVIVDLPGTHDSNAARSAIAEEYIKQCNGLWIIAPITRAVDDKAAKLLLSGSFKRQLKMDGGFNMVTFICSKTDDISLMECQESLGISQITDLWIRSEKLTGEKLEVKKRMKELENKKCEYSVTIDEIEEKLEMWDSLKDDMDNCKAVITWEQSQSRKRKRRHHVVLSRKKCRSANSDIEGTSTDYEGDRTDSEREPEEMGDESRGDLLTEDQVTELKILKRNSRRHMRKLDEQIDDLQHQMSKLEATEDETLAKMSAIAIIGRNEYSRDAIRQDFAAGIKELDQELAEEGNPENFNPDIEIRDYDKLARSLPVFCVSSRAYQKLQGRLKKEPSVLGFHSIQETEIPPLQTHCIKLTEAAREGHSWRFLSSLDQLLNSLRLWCSSYEGSHLAGGQRAGHVHMIRDEFKELRFVSLFCSVFIARPFIQIPRPGYLLPVVHC